MSSVQSLPAEFEICADAQNYELPFVREIVDRQGFRSNTKSILPGDQFGYLTVIKQVPQPAHLKQKRAGRFFLCVCNCGENRTKITSARTLRRGTTISCGCAYRRRADNTYKTSEPALRSLFSEYKGNARQRGIAWELTYEEFYPLALSTCFYCDKPPSRKKGGPLGPDKGVTLVSGVDRVLSQLTYSVANTVSCCDICNRAKSDLTLEAFASYVQRFQELGRGAPFEDPKYIFNSWCIKLSARNLPNLRIE